MPELTFTPVGAWVKLAPDYAQYGDAAKGPLEPGQVSSRTPVGNPVGLAIHDEQPGHVITSQALLGELSSAEGHMQCIQGWR